MKLLALALMLAGCVSVPVDAPPVMTLYVQNMTDNQQTVYANHQRLGIVGPLQSACLPILGLSVTGDVTLYFRALAAGVIAASPMVLASDNAWMISLRQNQTSGSFFPVPAAEPCRK